MKWTKEKPNEEGHYWVRCEATSGVIYDVIVKVYRGLKEDRYPNNVYQDGRDIEITDKSFKMWGDSPIAEIKEDE